MKRIITLLVLQVLFANVSFSKIIVPGFRLGWLVAPTHIMKKLIIAKQATDLHTSHFTQSIVFQYLKNNDVDSEVIYLGEFKMTKIYNAFNPNENNRVIKAFSHRKRRDDDSYI